MNSAPRTPVACRRPPFLFATAGLLVACSAGPIPDGLGAGPSVGGEMLGTAGSQTAASAGAGATGTPTAGSGGMGPSVSAGGTAMGVTAGGSATGAVNAGAGGAAGAGPALASGGMGGTAAGGSVSTSAGNGAGGTAGTATAGSGAGGVGEAGTSAGGAGTGGVSTTDEYCPASALICDDFEDGTLDKWEQNQQGGTLSVGTGFAASGDSALVVDVPTGQYGGYIRLTGAPLFPLPDKLMWGRAMVLYEGTVPDQHSDIVRAADATSGVPFYNLGSQHEEILLNYYVSYPAEDCWSRPDPSYSLSADTWMCWEWRMDGNRNEIEFFIDGESKMVVAGQGSRADDGCVEGDDERIWVAPDFGSFQIGAYISEGGATTNQKIWIDDVAVGTEGRIGCPPP